MKKEAYPMAIELNELKKILEKRREQRLAKARRLEAFYRLKLQHRKNRALFDSLVKQGLLLNKEDKRKQKTETRKILGDDRLGLKRLYLNSVSRNLLARSDLEYVPSRNVAVLAGTRFPICQCGEAEIYLQPAWTGQIGGPYLDYWLWGDGKSHVYNWDDAPPDFEWKVKPQAGQFSTASAHMNMSVEGGDDGWNQSWAWLWVYASWLPQSPGRFTAHAHFGGPDGPTNAGIVGDGCEPWPWDDEAYFGAWISLLVGYYDSGNWVTLGDSGWRTIADNYEDRGRRADGTCPWYWKLDHWLALGEYSIPVNKRVYMIMGIDLETSAGSDDECESGVFFDEGRELLIRPVITGTQCTRI